MCVEFNRIPCVQETQILHKTYRLSTKLVKWQDKSNIMKIVLLLFKTTICYKEINPFIITTKEWI